MSDVLKAYTPAWRKAAGVFKETSTGATSAVQNLLSSTTDPAACNAANGMATVDGAISVMLTVFGEVMANEVLTSIGEGLTSEGEALESTAVTLDQMEQDNTQLASGIGGELG